MVHQLIDPLLTSAKGMNSHGVSVDYLIEDGPKLHPTQDFAAFSNTPVDLPIVRRAQVIVLNQILLRLDLEKLSRIPWT